MENELINTLYKKKMLVIYRYLIRIGCSPADAEDIMQETFYKALCYIDALDADRISSWVLKVALNQYYDLCRSRKRYPSVSLDDEVFCSRLAGDFLTEDFIIKKEQREEVTRVLDTLSPVYKNLLILKYGIGLSYKEMSEILDINESVIGTYLYRARKSFKRVWEQQFQTKIL